MASSPAPRIHVALDSVISGDSALDGILVGRKVYSLEADEKANKPYIILGSTEEDSRGGVFAASLKGTIVDITGHSSLRTAQECMTIYDHLTRLLDYKKLTLTDLDFIQGRLTLKMILPPEKPGAAFGASFLAEYEVISHGPR